MRVAICGILGKMGRKTLTVLQNSGHEVVFGVDTARTDIFSSVASANDFSPGSARFGNAATELSDAARDGAINNAPPGSVSPGSSGAAENAFSGVPVYAAFPAPGGVGKDRKLDGVIDFSAPPALKKTLFFAEASKIPAVIASTGISEDDRAALRFAAERIPVFYAENLSIGIFALKTALAAADAALAGFDRALVETHRKGKKDAPSGTALSLLSAMGDPLSVRTVSLREGEVPGTHEVRFFGRNEELCFSHRAYDGAVFAEGAVKALTFLQGKYAGLYGMKDLFYAPPPAPPS